MFKVNCLNCGSSYAIKEDLLGKVVRCPHCRIRIRVGTEMQKDVGDDDLRAELARLAGGKSDTAVVSLKEKPAPASAATPPAQEGKPGRKATPRRKKPAEAEAPSAPKRTPARGRAARAAPAAAAPKPRTAVVSVEPEGDGAGPSLPRSGRDHRAVVVGVLALVLLAGGGFVGATVYRMRKADAQQQERESADAVTLAVKSARETQTACNEAAAIEAWRKATGLAQVHVARFGSVEFAFVDAEAVEQIAQLQGRLEERRRLQEAAGALFQSGERRFADKDYAGAQADLTTFLARSEGFACAYDELPEQRRVAQERLASEPVVMTASGRVWHEASGAWKTPAEIALFDRTQQIASYKAEGRVEYPPGSGRWVMPAEVAAIKAARAAEAARRQAIEKAQAAQMELLAWMRSEQARVERSISEGEPEVTLDSGAEGVRWVQENWANGIQTSVSDEENPEDRWLVVRLGQGNMGKWVITLQQPADISGYDELLVDIDLGADGKSKVALGVWERPMELFESPEQRIRGRTTLRFDLKATNFKTRETGWKYQTAILHPDRVYRFSLFVYSRETDTIRVRNVRMVRRAAPRGGRRP